MRKLEAPEGYYYTQAGDVQNDERCYSTIIFLAYNDSPDNYRLATAAEKDAWEADNE